MTRPLLSCSLEALEAQVVRNEHDDAELALIEQELRHRHRPRAHELLARVQVLRGALTPTVADADPGKDAGVRTIGADILPGLPGSRARQPSSIRERIAMTDARRPADDLTSAVPAAHLVPADDAFASAAPMTDTRRWTEGAVASLRTKLIDLGKKNPLISFKHGGRSASILRIVDERPDLLCAAIDRGAVGFEPLPGEEETPRDEQTPAFRIAYERARLTDVAFLATTEALSDDERDAKAWRLAERALRAAVRAQLGMPLLDYGKALDVAAIARAHGFDPSYDLKASDEGDVPAHHEDDRLRVLLTATELERRLKTIWEKYKSHERETGIDTLFLAIGFVEWREELAPDTALHAPLLLLPVRLERTIVRGRYEYRLSKREDPIEVNVALAEKMRRDWNLALPALRPDESPESYFVRVVPVLKLGRKLALQWYVTLATLPPMVLWKDLDPAIWPEAAFASHRLLPGLVGAAEMAGETSLAATIDIDAPEWATTAPALIRPADASQHSALIDMAAGHDLAIEGPPGTGKSETITNMIATALTAGKKVLFVAEKQAALRVVANRLRESGFGALLLELHGDNVNRTDIYDGLRARLSATVRVDQNLLVSQRAQLNQKRTLLRRYIKSIDSNLGALDRSAYWLAWREIGLRDSFDHAMIEEVAARWQVPDVATIDRAALEAHRGHLTTFGDALIAIDAERRDGERTRWTLAGTLDPFDQRRQLDAAATAARAAAGMGDTGAAMASDGVAMPGPAGPLTSAVAQLADLVGFEPVDEALVLAALRDADTARGLLRQQSRWRQLCGKLADDVAAPGAVATGDVATLGDAIAGVRPVPLTVTVARERMAATRAAIALADSTATDRALLADRLALDPALDLTSLRAVLAAVVALDEEPATVVALYRADLLDPLAEAALHGERVRAAALREERVRLATLVNDEAFEVEPSELTRIADVLTDAGLFARLFGSDYKAAHRRATRLAKDASERLATAELLQQGARHLGQAATFRRDSAVAGWFPAMLWKGAESDWDAIQRARIVLIEARRQLAVARADATLSRWLAATADERSRIAHAIARVLPMIDAGSEAGLASQPVASMAGALATNERTLAALDAALAKVDALPGGQIVREGQNLAARLGALHAAATEFAALARQPGYDWVGAVGEPLEPLAHTLAHADTLRGLDGPLPIVPALIASDAPAALLDRLIETGGKWREAEQGWRAAAWALSVQAKLATDRLGEDWATLTTALDDLARDETGARLAADLQKYGRALDEVRLGALGHAALDGHAPVERLADFYELLLVRDLLRTFLGGDGAELGRLGTRTLAQARATFTRLDIELHELEASAIVAQRLKDKPPRGVSHGPKAHYTQMGLLESDLELKRPRTPLRDVVHRAGAALQALKPVWMMSPTSAAQYIRPGTLDFDLLVVDEASQMRPEFAVSAILRGSQFVVVGDANQLPPSDHFQTVSKEEEDDDEASIARGTESILDLANQRFRHKRQLQWHYRSKHESLIQFSNREFYKGNLVVFPSPSGNDDPVLGVKNTYVPDKYADTLYEASINQREAQAVIEEASFLMRAYPQYSIGIAAMNAKQTELIQNEFDRLILGDADVRHYVESFAGGVEEFFIKNLENVQGDERDIILISTVYGPGKDGKVAQNFGLMNREVGWRRLNVLVTRAKLSTRLFTSLRPDDVKATATSSRGLRAFRNYLTYAHGGALYDDDRGGPPDSDFEVFVADALRGAGYEVVPQVGVKGFRIDLGVKHPDYPLGYIAGIECDGASFHRGLTVRDRDRIRQSVLEGMGWRIYRIWSTDWFADPTRELAQLLAYLDKQRATFAEVYAHRPRPAEADVAPVEAVAAPAEPERSAPPSRLQPVLEALDAPVAGLNSEPEAPIGRIQRSLGDFDWYEVVSGQLYAVWVEGRLAGEVEVLSRATAAPQVYGVQRSGARSEYEGRMEVGGDRFIMHDIYAAVREVARRVRPSE